MSNNLSVQDIKRIREKYGLTQQGFARLLGIGEASIVRYESGQQPSKANANLIRAADNPKFISDCLERDGDLLTEGQREKTERIVYALVSFDEDGDAMDINEIYEITLQQEVLIEQVAHLAGKVSHLLIAARERGDEICEAVYEDVLKQLASVRPSITYKENSSSAKLSEIRGQIECLRSITESREVKAA